MVLHVRKIVSALAKLEKGVASKAKQIKNYSLFPMDRGTAGCLVFGGSMLIPTVFMMNCGGPKKHTSAAVDKVTNENDTTKQKTQAVDMDEIIEKYGYLGLDSLGNNTYVDALDTLEFISEEDASIYKKLHMYANGLYRKAKIETDKAFNKADSIADRNFFVADSIGDAQFSKYYAQEVKALESGNLDAVRKYRKLRLEAFRKSEKQKLKVLRDGEEAKLKAFRDGEAAKNKAFKIGRELQKEACNSLNVIVRPYKSKNE